MPLGQSICVACRGQCCRSLPFATARRIIAEVFQANPDIHDGVQRIIHPVDGKTICAFLDEEFGCVLDEADRSSICLEFKCDLFSIAERDPAMVGFCLDHGKVEMTNVWSMHDWQIICDPACPYQDRCRIPNRIKEN